MRISTYEGGVNRRYAWLAAVVTAVRVIASASIASASPVPRLRPRRATDPRLRVVDDDEAREALLLAADEEPRVDQILGDIVAGKRAQHLRRAEAIELEPPRVAERGEPYPDGMSATGPERDPLQPYIVREVRIHPYTRPPLT